MGVTKIGSPDANIPQDIQLVGAHIASEHCVFQNMDGVVSMTPQPGALCYLNGRKVRACRRRKKTEAKAKVVAAVWGTEFIQFLAALAFVH